MKLLDRYILRQFLANFLILLAVVVLLATLVDLILDLDAFLGVGRDRGAGLGGVLLAAAAAALDWYYPLWFLMYVFFSGLVIVAAAGFTFAGLSRHGELLALLTSGLSMHRIALPVIVGGAVLSALALPVQEVVIPALAHKLLRSKGQAHLDTVGAMTVRYIADGRGNLLSARRFDPAAQTLSDVAILVRDRDRIAGQRITAVAARWDEPRGGWELTDGRAVDRLGGQDRYATPDRGPRPLAFFATDLSPQVLTAKRAGIYARFLGLPELMRMAGSDAADRITLQRVMHGRFSLIVLNVLVLVLVLPFFLTREPVNYLLQAVKAMGVGLLAWSAGFFVIWAGLPLDMPVVEAWLPVLVYLPVTAWALQLVRT